MLIMITVNNSIELYETPLNQTQIPIDPAPVQSIIGYRIRNQYDLERYKINNVWVPIYTRYKDILYYGIPGQLNADGIELYNQYKVNGTCNLDLKQSKILCSTHVLALPFSIGKNYIDSKYREFDIAVWVKSPVEPLFKIGEMYVFMFV